MSDDDEKTAALSAAQVAGWMLEQLNHDNVLYQHDAAHQILHNFGDAFIYENQNGNLAIRQNVLRLFRALTGNTVVWERGERLWRPSGVTRSLGTHD